MGNDNRGTGDGPDIDTGHTPVHYEHSSNLAPLLHTLGISVLLSTYQAGKLIVLGSDGKRLTFSFHHFDQVMGIAVAPDRIAVGTRRQIHWLRAAHELASSLPGPETFDGCFMARDSRVTGNIHGHELAYGDGELWVVNTLFSCLCTLDDDFSFFPRWRPPFVTELAAQDRCHLNGMAIERGTPRYVTLLGLTNEPAGWRPDKKDGGAIIDVHTGAVVSSGLCMPHSPRVHGGRLWVLNSGRGELSEVDIRSGELEAICEFPGYTRGMACFEDYAFVGLSRIRETNVFGGLPIGANPQSLRCGFGVVELSTGRTIATLSFLSGVDELFAVEVIPGVRNPKVVGPSKARGEEDEVWIVPAPGRQTMPSVKPKGLVDPARFDELTRQAELITGDDNPEAAIESLRTALRHAPTDADLLNRLGNLHQDRGDQERAKAYYRQSIDANPRFAPAHQNLGILAVVDNQPQRALAHFATAQAAAPRSINLALAAKVLPVIYEDLEHLRYWRERFVTCVRQLVADGITIDTTDSLVDTSFYLAYQGFNDREVMADLGQVYRGVAGRELTDRRRPRGRKIRVGFLSAYFRDHTIGRLNLGRVRELSRERFDVTVIATNRSADAMTEAFRAAADHHVVLPRQARVAQERIKELKLDILLFADIGMDSLTQSLCYSRMAPIQAATWGHPVTSGSPMIDHFLSTALAEPDGASDHYTERLESLPNLGVYYERPHRDVKRRDKESFGIRPRPHTYLCPQTAFKFHPAFDQALGGILEADPEAELVVIGGRVGAWTDTLKRRWAKALPDGLGRVSFLDPMCRNDFLDLLSTADVILDPYPFGGGNTSYEAFAVATPVVTCPGDFLRGRLTAAMYQRMGVRSMIASDTAEYIKIAVALASDPQSNLTARQAIAEASSILFENREDVLALEDAFLRWVECD